MKAIFNARSIADCDCLTEIFVVAEGYVTGTGNGRPTRDIVRDMIEQSFSSKREAEAYPYILWATPPRSRIWRTGHYRYKTKRVPLILVVECGKLHAGNATVLLQWLKKLFQRGLNVVRIRDVRKNSPFNWSDGRQL
jgi:hypothetical protein